MANAFASGVGLFVFGACLCASRAWWIFRTRLPAAANVETSTYTDRDGERNSTYFHGWYTRGRAGVRLIREKVRFEDVDGHQRTAWVSRWISREHAPFSTYVVWYGRAPDGRVTANGPGYWLAATVYVVLLLIGWMILFAQLPSNR